MDVRALRKAELHCHIDGLLDPAMIEQLAAGGESLGVDAGELDAVYPIRSVDDWLMKYAPLADRASRPLDRWLPRFLELHVARLRAQNVVYAEIFVSGLLSARADLGELVEFFSKLRARAIAAAGPALEVELVICIGRGPAARLASQAPRIAALRRAGLIVGVALAGAEETFAVRPLERFFDEFRDLGLGIEIHAGEFAGTDSVRDALRYGRPDRLGHAIAAFSDQALLAEIAERGVHIELCPSSNLALGSVRAIEQHPIARARAAGLSFSINTDDPGLFACSLTSEMELVARTFGFGERDFETIFDNTMRAAFRGR
jgi:adenosine deaminase